MPCSVLGCEGKDEEGRILKCYRFPSDKHYRDLWTYLCRKKEEVSTEARVCSKHFSANQYVKDLQAERLGTKPRKVLKGLAVPDINLPRLLHANMITMSQMVQEVRELYLGKTHPSGPFTCNAMSPRVILIQLSQKYIDKYTRENDPLSEEESWDTDAKPCDMNLLEPLVEISDNAGTVSDRTRKRKNNAVIEEHRKRGRSAANVQTVPSESVYLNIPIKQEPIDPAVSEVQPPPLAAVQDPAAPMATIPVVNSASTIPGHIVEAVGPEGTDSFSVRNFTERGRRRTATKNTNKNNANVVKIKQEEGGMASVFVVPFGTDINAPPPPPDPRTAAIAEGIALSESTSSRKLRELTLKLSELSKRNLECESKIEKMKEEFKTRLEVAEEEKRGIEEEVDSVLSDIQKWKNARNK